MANPDLLVVFIYPLKKNIPASDDSEIRRSPPEQSTKSLVVVYVCRGLYQLWARDFPVSRAVLAEPRGGLDL